MYSKKIYFSKKVLKKNILKLGNSIRTNDLRISNPIFVNTLIFNFSYIPIVGFVNVGTDEVYMSLVKILVEEERERLCSSSRDKFAPDDDPLLLLLLLRFGFDLSNSTGGAITTSLDLMCGALFEDLHS